MCVFSFVLTRQPFAKQKLLKMSVAAAKKWYHAERRVMV
jgi:hypothetical protein